ncbi:DUF1266 domain-containing protein [Streptomyces sp. NPDC059740]|uniref:DUF1266 domain-containing protein n=1 Tax=Streptomyces sp. NPDC059740 TaxID=3346926 RepID=UPI00365B935B
MAAQIAGIRRLIGRIARYEARFRSDGLLSEGRFVRTVEAWDYGRASCMARWGVAARFCTLQEAEHAVVGAGRRVAVNYRSWEDFSAAFILGRCPLRRGGVRAVVRGDGRRAPHPDHRSRQPLAAHPLAVSPPGHYPPRAQLPGRTWSFVTDLHVPCSPSAAAPPDPASPPARHVLTTEATGPVRLDQGEDIYSGQ